MKVEEEASWWRCAKCECPQFLVYLPVLAGPAIARMRVYQAHNMTSHAGMGAGDNKCMPLPSQLRTEWGGVTLEQIAP